MLKKLTILMLTLAMAFAMTLAFTACGGSDEQAEEETEATEPTETTEPAAGGWEVVAEPEAATLPSEVQTVFDKYLADYDDELIPLAYYGKQIVAGTNYGLLCKSKKDNELVTAVLQEDLGNNVNGLVNQFIISNYTEGSGNELSGEPEDGAWEVPGDATGSPIPEDAQAAYDKARNAYEGTAPQPMALLGTQVVAGTNYAFLARGKTDTDEPVTAIQVVTVYADLEDNAEITNIYTLDMGEFNE